LVGCSPATPDVTWIDPPVAVALHDSDFSDL
jgi:hypothetical protein